MSIAILIQLEIFNEIKLESGQDEIFKRKTKNTKTV